MKKAKKKSSPVKTSFPFKESESLYPNLFILFGGYLMQDYTIIGNTIEEVVACYKEDITPAMCQAAIQEVDDFISRHPNDLDEHFEELYGFNFSPKLWGYTTATFFEHLKTLLAK